MNACVRIERAARGDLPRLVALLSELFGIERDFAADPERQARGLRLLLDCERAAVFVARDAGGTAIGMASVQLVISTAEGAPSAWIEDVIVSSEHRGEGIGRALLEAALGWARARGATRAQLLVDAGNAPAQRFYEKQGWSATRLAARRRGLD
jgi:GNAT superfamily N-acetyltransferase